jgi:predicted nucleic acid-binding protein
VVVECIAVAVRAFDSTQAGRLFSAFISDMGFVVVPSDGAMIEAALQEVDRLGCGFYDAFAPAVATLTDAELWSADRRAHGGRPGTVIVGE